MNLTLTSEATGVADDKVVLLSVFVLVGVMPVRDSESDPVKERLVEAVADGKAVLLAIFVLVGFMLDRDADLLPVRDKLADAETGSEGIGGARLVLLPPTFVVLELKFVASLSVEARPADAGDVNVDGATLVLLPSITIVLEAGVIEEVTLVLPILIMLELKLVRESEVEYWLAELEGTKVGLLGVVETSLGAGLIVKLETDVMLSLLKDPVEIRTPPSVVLSIDEESIEEEGVRLVEAPNDTRILIESVELWDVPSAELTSVED